MTVTAMLNVNVLVHVLKIYFDSTSITSKEAEVVEAMLLAAPTAEEKEENRVLVSALGNNDGDVAEEEMETGTEAALPTPASAAAIGEVAETVTDGGPGHARSRRDGGEQRPGAGGARPGQ